MNEAELEGTTTNHPPTPCDAERKTQVRILPVIRVITYYHEPVYTVTRMTVITA
jgi:hypothetical protein